MTRFLTTFNLIGVVALAFLCAVQWREEGRLIQQVDQLDQVRQQQAEKIVEQNRTIQGQMADLDEFRSRLSLAETDLHETERKLAIATNDIQRLTMERNQLQAAVKKWVAAVTERDAALKQAGQFINKLAAERNRVIVQFNDLAAKYNALVKASSRPSSP